MEYESVQHVNQPIDASAFLPESETDIRVNNVLEADPIPSPVLFPTPQPVTSVVRTPLPLVKDSFKEIKASGRVKMTNYVHSRVDILYPLAHIPHIIANRAGRTDINKFTCQDVQVKMDEKLGGYIEVTDYDRLLKLGLFHQVINQPANKSNAVLSDLVSDSSSTLDLLTELAEVKDTISLITSTLSMLRRPLQSFTDARRRVNSKVSVSDRAEKIGELWLGYRYAVMPLIYTIQDAIKVLQQKDRVFGTSRSYAVEKSVSTYNPSLRHVKHLYDEGTITVTYRGTSKARFNTTAINIYSLLGFNPLRTGWELVPLSFVVDWALNVGSWLESKTFEFSDIAEDRKMCVSTKTSSDITTYLYVPSEEQLPLQEIRSSYCNNHLYYTFGKVTRPELRLPVKQYKEESYERRLVVASDVTLDFDPFLDWKRGLDSLSLSIIFTKSALKGLKGK